MTQDCQIDVKTSGAQDIESLQFANSIFEAVAPLGEAFSFEAAGTDCDVCCPGSCTGCTKCNKCNLLF